MAMENKVERIQLNGQSYIKKELKSPNEWFVLTHFLNREIQVPTLIRAESTENRDVILILEDVGQDHLELHPDLYEVAFANLLKIQTLHLDTEVTPITTNHLLTELAQEPDLAEIGITFGWDCHRSRFINDMWEWVRHFGTFDEPVVFSHGDYHPRNILVRNHDLITIDWEKAGYHSIFQDLYALLHMSYPDREACLTTDVQERLFQLFADQLDILHMQKGYETFFLLQRLHELVCIRRDLQMGVRSTEKLLIQAESIFLDLERRFQTKIDKENGVTCCCSNRAS